MYPDETSEIDADKLDDVAPDRSTGATEAPEPQPVKRGRGRPRKDGTPTGSPRTSQSSDSRPRTARRSSKTWIREQCMFLVGSANIGLSLVSAEDTLDDEEMDALTDALTAEAMASERILKWMEVAGKFSPHVLLLQAVVKISIPRLQRRGILPVANLTPEQEAMLSEALRQSTTEAENHRAEFQPETSIPLGARPAPFAGG